MASRQIYRGEVKKRMVGYLHRGRGIDAAGSKYEGDNLKLIRVFPRRTKATPVDELAIVGRGPFLWETADEVHISVSFTWDIPLAEQLEKQWRHVAPTKIGGPAYNDPGGEFIPGMYLKPGYVITSRGCPNRCWFCSAWKNEGPIRELPITDGWIVQDNNLLACSLDHQELVFKMLLRQKERAHLMGLEAALFTPAHAGWLMKLKPKGLWFAYDEPADIDPLIETAQLLRSVGIIRQSSHVASCYVLVGYEKDTIPLAEKRLQRTLGLGFMPQAMLFNRRPEKEWRRFQREWANKVIVGSKMQHRGKEEER